MKRKKRKADSDLKLRRADVILRVRSGAITATEGARELGVSRKTYYKWEERALAGMMNELGDQPVGRPGPSPEEIEVKELKAKLAKMEERVADMKKEQELKDAVWQFKVEQAAGKLKKTT